ncbi:MAG: chitobiase/beta-hexosaminidase C-terminal domain-containing protein [Terracidiphilus sp.]
MAFLLFIFLLAAPQTQAQVPTSGDVFVPSMILAVAGGGTAAPSTTAGSGTGAKLQNSISVATDSAGNVYIADPVANVIEKLDVAGNISVIAGGGSTKPSATPITATSSKLNEPYGVATDSSGNVYIADSGNYLLEKLNSATKQIVVIAGGGSTQPSLIPEPSANASIYPTSVVVDNAGNAYITDGIRHTIFKLDTAGKIGVIAGGGSTVPSTQAGSASSASISPSGLAVDATGNLYIVDSDNALIEKLYANAGAWYIQVIAGGGSTHPSTTPEPAFSAGLQSPGGIALDSFGNLYICDGQSEIEELSLATQQIVVIAGGQGETVGTTPELATETQISPSAVAVDSVGNIYIADNVLKLIEKVGTSAAFPATAVGSASASQTLYVQLTAGTAPKNVLSAMIVPTSQNGEQEFVVGPVPGTCPIMSTPDGHFPTCAVQVVFNPQYPGMRTGMLDLVDSVGALIGTVGLSGTGVGPMGVFEPGVPMVVNIHSADLALPVGAAVDGAGNLYVVNSTTSNIVATNDIGVKVTATGSETTFSLTYSGVTPDLAHGVAVDAAGNLYFSTIINNQNEVVKLWHEGSGRTSLVSTGSIILNNPMGLATDAAGNLYIADNNNSVVVVAKPDGSAYVLPTNGVTLDRPTAVAVDPAGNVFILDNNDVTKVSPDGTATAIDVNGVSIPEGIAVDGTGTLYVLGYQGALMEIAPDGTQTMLSIAGLSISSTGGLAVDAAGNIYVVDGNNNRVVEIARNTAGLNFANTDQGATSSDSSQTVTLRNIGNEPLAITAISYPADFPEAAGASTDCASSTPLAAAETCTLTIDFSPMAKSTIGTSQTLNEKVTLTDNTMNIKGSSQSASLSGEETNILPQAATPTFSVAEGTYTSPQTVTISDADPSAWITVTVTIGQSSPIYSQYKGPITVSSTETITAVASDKGYSDSAVATATYTINLPALTLSPATLPSGTQGVAYSQQLTASNGAAPYTYAQTGGALPNGVTLSSSGKLSGTPTVNGTFPISVTATDSGKGAGQLTGRANFSLVIAEPAVPTPTFSVVSGTYTSTQTVTISDSTTGAAIYYSTNGSQPTIAYTGPITVSASETITAVAILSGYTNSPYATATYTINIPTAATPTISPVAGTFTTGQTVTISDTTSGAAIYYTTDGSAPTAQSTLYTSAISVGRTETIKAIAVAANYINSAIASAAYTIIPLGSPDFTIAAAPSSLTITGGQSATLSVSVTPQNAFASAVSFTCAGLPAGATCTFAPATVTPSGTTASTTTLTVTTAAATAMYHRNSNPLLPASTLAVAFCLLGWKKRRNMQLFLLLAVSVIGMSLFTGCGGSTTSNHTQPVTSVVTVTGISGTGSSALHNAATFSLTVN